jgi:hypothetical protein
MAEGSSVKKAIVYYTDSVSVPDYISEAVQYQLNQAGIPIISVSHKPMDFGTNVCVGDIGRSRVSMTKQVLLGLSNTDADVVFLAEHDVLYHKCHFDFVPTDANTLYFNQNLWRVRASDGVNRKDEVHGAKSQACAFRECLQGRFKERLDCFMNDQPPSGLHGFRWYKREPESMSAVYKFGQWASEVGNIDIRHGGNLTGGRTFRNKGKSIPGWGDPRGRFKEFLNDCLERGSNG